MAHRLPAVLHSAPRSEILGFVLLIFAAWLG